MAQITVKYDPSIEIEEIEEPMYAISAEEGEGKTSSVQQTKITGIFAPLIKVNNIVVLWDQIRYFKLSSVWMLPTLQFTFIDTYGFTKSLDQPGNDNIVLVQILPPFEDAYKKVSLRFFIDDINIVGSEVTISAKYNVPELYQYKLESFGKLSTYNLFDKIAKNCELGFASNVDETKDERYIYIRNSNYADTLEREISVSSADNCVLDAWIDFHNYLILCDIQERYTAIDSDLKVWTSPYSFVDTNNDNDGKEAGVEPREEDAILTNSPALSNSQLYITNYSISNASGSNLEQGTDKVIQAYYMNNGEESSVLIQDGDVHKDTYVKTIYAGEIFGDYDYFTSKLCRRAFLQKVNSTTIDVELTTPLLGLERGERVDLQWYDINEMITELKKDNPIETNTPINEDPDDPGQWVLNKQVSGQYLIISTIIEYDSTDNGWHYKLKLARPADQVNTYLSESNE